MVELQNQIHSPIIKFEKKSLWRRLLRMPIRKTVAFMWNLLMMFQVVLPLNITSRLWGWINALNLPVWSRIPIYQLYSWLYRCNLDEMVEPNLKTYSNLSEFFRRSLKPECRPIDGKASLVTISVVHCFDSCLILIGRRALSTGRSCPWVPCTPDSYRMSRV